MKYIWL